MALGRLSVKPGKVGRAGKHADYILRKNEYAKSMKEASFWRLSASGICRVGHAKIHRFFGVQQII